MVQSVLPRPLTCATFDYGIDELGLQSMQAADCRPPVTDACINADIVDIA